MRFVVAPVAVAVAVADAPPSDEAVRAAASAAPAEPDLA
jgi:hypothetical protein